LKRSRRRPNMTGPDAPGIESMTISCRDQWPKKSLHCQ
jgi:hypothetical protein